MYGLKEYSATEIRRLRDSAGLLPATSVSALRQRPACASTGLVLFSAHIGPSMNPTLCDLDLLEIVSYGGKPAQVGDVVMFLPPEGDQPVVHRVVNVTPLGIFTRGDHNSQVDPNYSHASDVVGRVVAAWRGRRRRAIAGGAAGRWVARFTRWGLAIDRTISRLLYPLYQALAKRGPLRPLLPAGLRPRVMDFGAENGGRLRLMMGRRTVGVYDEQRRRWVIRRPFRLFVDESRLPGPSSRL